MRGFRWIAALAALALAVPAAAEGPALWRVADEDTTIYLFGTFHALPEGIDWYRGPVVPAFEAADELVLESADPEEGEVETFGARMMLPEGKSLRARLPQPVRQRFDTAIARQRMPVAMADRLKPWAAAFLIAGEGSGGRMYLGEQGVETVLTARAKALDKPVGELEGVEGQLDIFDSIPSPVQIRFLNDTLMRAGDDAAEAREDRILDAWIAGDEAGFAREADDFAGLPELRAILLDRRNANWVAWIRNRLERPGTVLMAVGAAHLSGADSLQAHLAKAGLAATRVTTADIAADIAPAAPAGQEVRR